MRRLTTLAAATATAVVLAGCTATGTGDPSATADQSASTQVTALASLTPEAVLAENEDATTVNDDEWSLADAVDVTLSGTTASSESNSVEASDGTVTITGAGVYRLTGSLDGQVVVEAPEDAQVVLVLDGVTISSSTTAAIAVTSADDAAIYLADGTSNVLSDTSEYPDEADTNAALFSEQDLTISGTGSLTVTGNGNDGITSEDDLVILSGNIAVTAADDGLRGKDSLTVKGGSTTVTAGGDGLKADNEDEPARGYIDIESGSIDITAGDDGLDAATDVVITGGDTTVTTSGTDSDEATSKGVDAGSTVAIAGGTLTVTKAVEAIESALVSISGGTVDLTSSDDGINASTGTGESMQADAGASLVISGGTLTVDAEGDGLDSNGDALVSGGTITVYGPTRSGNGAIDSNGTFNITGGTLVAFDSGGMPQAPDASSSQGWLAASASGSAGDTVTITDDSGLTLGEFTAKKAFGLVVFSSSDVASGQTYAVNSTTVTAGEASEGGFGGRSGPGGDQGAPPGR